MRKIRLFASAAAFLLLLCGCQGQTARGSGDFQYYLHTNVIEQMIAESDDGFYIKVAGFMTFCDKENLQAAPLCCRPECSHTSLGTDPAEKCDAFFGLGTPCMTGGQLFVCCRMDGYKQPAIAALAADGSSRRPLIFLEGTPGFFLVHRGKAYVTIWETVIEGKLSADSGIWEYDLNRPFAKPRHIYNRKTFFGDEDAYTREGISNLLAYDHYLYFLDRRVDGHEGLCLFVLDLDTGVMTIPELQDSTGSSTFLAIFRDRVYINRFFFESGGETGGENRFQSAVLQSYALDGSDAHSHGLFPYGMICADSRYFYQMDILPVDKGEDDHRLRVYDTDLTLLREFSLGELYEKPEELTLLTPIPTESDFLLLVARGRSLDTGFGFVSYDFLRKSELTFDTVPRSTFFSAIIPESGEAQFVY